MYVTTFLEWLSKNFFLTPKDIVKEEYERKDRLLFGYNAYLEGKLDELYELFGEEVRRR